MNTILFDFDGTLSNGRFYFKVPLQYQKDKSVDEQVFTIMQIMEKGVINLKNGY